MAGHTVALSVDNGCYHLTDPWTAHPLLYHTGTSGLVGVLGDGAACVCTGTLTGFIRITVLATREPPIIDLAAWDEIVEVPFTSPSGRFGPAQLEASQLPNLATAGSGLYRLRVHARGRDAANHARIIDDVDEITEEHFIISWPDDGAEPETIIQTSDAIGASLRARPSDPSTMPLPDPMSAGGVDMRRHKRTDRPSETSTDPIKRIQLD